MAQVYPTGTRVRYIGSDVEHHGATGEVVGMHSSEWLHRVRFDKPLGVNPFNGERLIEADVNPYALCPILFERGVI